MSMRFVVVVLLMVPRFKMLRPVDGSRTLVSDTGPLVEGKVYTKQSISLSFASILLLPYAP